MDKCFRFASGMLGFVFLLFLSQCGFKPLYKTGEEGTLQELADINITVISDRDGQILRNTLMQTLTPYGSPENPAYSLIVDIKEGIQNFGILKDATTSQTEFTFNASFSLVERCTRKELFKGKSVANANYNTIPTAPFSTVTEADYAKKKAIESLAFDIRRQLGAFFLLGPKETEEEPQTCVWTKESVEEEETC